MRNTFAFASIAAAGASLLSLTSTLVYAQQSFDDTTCRAGTPTVIAKSDDMLLTSVDHRGITRSNTGNKIFENVTQHCIGTVFNIAGKRGGSGWCKSVNPSNGDVNLVEWIAGEKQGEGTFKFVYGTGKWKGISGGGTYESSGAARPVDEGTYQNCVRVKGTVTIPG
jgi:hypothetical protein